jgi:hypothetical protein
MANSVFPDLTSAGGVEYRDAAGNPINPPDVHNAYPPLPAFLSTCLIAALPSNCDARIEPRQINAIVSELLSFAECLDPNGTWDCNSLKNLCAAFTAWMAENLKFIVIADAPPPAPQEPSLWWESDTGYTYIWYNDGTSAQWVQIAGAKTIMDQVSIVGQGITADPHSVALVDCGQY